MSLDEVEDMHHECMVRAVVYLRAGYVGLASVRTLSTSFKTLWRQVLCLLSWGRLPHACIQQKFPQSWIPSGVLVLTPIKIVSNSSNWGAKYMQRAASDMGRAAALDSCHCCEGLNMAIKHENDKPVARQPTSEEMNTDAVYPAPQKRNASMQM